MAKATKQHRRNQHEAKNCQPFPSCRIFAFGNAHDFARFGRRGPGDKAIGEGEAVWDGSTKDASWVDADTYATATEYHLTTAAQLAGLATLTATCDFSGKTIYLDNDIYLNNISEIVSDTSFTRATDHKWGTSHMIKNFKGTFDGREHAVIRSVR